MLAPRITAGARRACLLAVLVACSDSQERTASVAERQMPSGWKILDAIDFNDDGLGDAEWTDTTTGRVAITLMAGTHLLDQGPPIQGPRGPGWAVVTAADFNADGMADVPWYSPVSKRLTVWLFCGTRVLEAGPEIPAPAGAGWTPVYAGDVNGDGMADVLWYDEPEHRIQMWLMQGTRIFLRGRELPGPPGFGWLVPTIADFNFDGLQDILWFNATTHRITVWLMNGTEVLERGPEIDGPPNGDWVAITASDFNRDGMSDVIWNDATTNRMAVWLMDGTCVLEAGPAIAGPSGAGWSVGSAADADGDGMADVFWQNPTERTMAIWTMSGTHVRAPGPAFRAPE
jgi:hypothetical protein